MIQPKKIKRTYRFWLHDKNSERPYFHTAVTEKEVAESLYKTYKIMGRPPVRVDLVRVTEEIFDVTKEFEGKES